MLLSALLLGFVGSLHCMGMCSPLVIAVTNIRTPYFAIRVIYNVSRIISYGIQGAIISVFGSLFHFSEFQTVFSIGLGCLLILLGFAGISQFKLPFISAVMQRFTAFIKVQFSKFLIKKTYLSISIIGFLNGLLPCGLTYLALTYCILLPDAFYGFLFMFFFGLGTFPVMLGFTSLALKLSKRFSIKIPHLVTIALIITGTILVFRTMLKHPVTIDSPAEIVICK